MNSRKVRHFVREFINDKSRFDVKYYLSNNFDLQNSNIDPIEHFLEYGIFEERNFSLDLSDFTYDESFKASESQLIRLLFKSNYSNKIDEDYNYKFNIASKAIESRNNFNQLVVIPNKNSYLNRLLLDIIIQFRAEKFNNITFLIAESIYGQDFLNSFDTNAKVLKGTNFQNINSLIDSVAENGNFILVDLLNIKVNFELIAKLVSPIIVKKIKLLIFIAKFIDLFKLNIDKKIYFEKQCFKFLFGKNLFLDTDSVDYLKNMLENNGYSINTISTNIFEVNNILEIFPYNVIRSSVARKHFSKFILESPFVFDLGAGGGEKFFLEMCIELEKYGSVTVINSHGISRKQINWLSNFLDLDLSSITFIDLPNCKNFSFDCDYYILQNNFLIPSNKIDCKSFFYHCQFPFELSALVPPNYSYLENCDKIFVYSHFVKNQIIEKFRVADVHTFPIIEVIPPMISDLSNKELRITSVSPMLQVCSIGRFSPKGHNKNQSFFLDLLRILESPNYFINLIGTCNFANPDDRDHFNSLEFQFDSLPVKLFPNLARHKLISILNNSDIYIHLAGLGVDVNFNPEKCEHFGIAPLEAMSCAVVPFVVNNGGPAEYIVDGINGYLFSSIYELKEKLEIFAKLNEEQKALIKSNARNTFLDYSSKSFSENIFKNLLDNKLI
jgi:glycosyltransferase involved in cell wall biosynthesis